MHHLELALASATELVLVVLIMAYKWWLGLYHTRACSRTPAPTRSRHTARGALWHNLLQLGCHDNQCRTLWCLLSDLSTMLMWPTCSCYLPRKPGTSTAHDSLL